MNGTMVRSYWTHLRVRAAACLRSPSAWLILLVFGMTAVVYWPALGDASNQLKDPLTGLSRTAVFLLWYWLWLAAPMIWVRGRACSRTGAMPLGLSAAPALPVGRRTRALAEATLALAVLGLIRWITLSLYQGEWAWGSLTATALGACFWFPMALAWALPAREPNVVMVRPLAIAVLATGLQHGTTVLLSWAGIIIAGILLTLLVLLTADVEVPEIGRRRRSVPASRRVRSAIGTRRQLIRDAWLPLVRVWGPWVVLGLVVFVVCLGIDLRGDGWRWMLFTGFEVFLVLTLMPVLRPFNSTLLAESLVGKHGVSSGAFIRAWQRLPVSRESVLRLVWAHGVVLGGLLWAAPVAILLIRQRVQGGHWSIVEAFGNLMPFFIAGGAMVPILAGLLVAVALGRTLEYALSGFSLLFGVHALFLVKLLLIVWFGRGSAPAEIGPIGILILLVALGSLPPLRFLVRAPEVG